MIQTKLKRYTKAGLYKAGLYETFLSMHINHAGNDNYYASPFYLEEWQREKIFKPIFGQGKLDENGNFVRSFSTALIGLPRNWGKTELSCAILLTVANCEPIYNGQYGIIAYSEAQATKIFKTIKTMINLDPDLRYQWEVMKNTIEHKETGAEILVFPYSEGAVQSWHFNLVIADELHTWRDSSVWDAIQSGQRDIPGALCIGISTASRSRSGFLWDLVSTIAPQDPSTYLCWIGANDSDSATSKRTWKKVSLPSWVTLDAIERQFKKTTRESFERYTLNRFPLGKVSAPAIKRRAITACQKQSAVFDFDEPFSVGVDGAVSGDTLAICAYQQQGERDVFATWEWSEPDESGYYDFIEVADVLEMLGKKKGLLTKDRVPCIGLDPARMVLLMKFVEKERGIKTFVVKQMPSIMCPASTMLKHSIESGKACLGGLETLADHARNCVEETHRAYGMRFSSEGSGQAKKHIDMAIAAAMAMYIYDIADKKRNYLGDQFCFSLTS